MRKNRGAHRERRRDPQARRRGRGAAGRRRPAAGILRRVLALRYWPRMRAMPATSQIGDDGCQTGSHWQIDNSMKAFDLARQICRTASAEIGDPKSARLAAAVASAKTVAATIGLARADRRHAATIDIWNADSWILAGQTTAAELRTGAVRPPCRTDYSTKRAAVDPAGGCPRWRQFLGEMTGGDADLQAYLQRVAGYCLTGLTSEHVMFFLYGTGANGKSVFINTLAGIWGDYAAVAAMKTFIASRQDHHPTDIAGLHGARLVIAQETERGRRWAESKIKILTGGDKITARFMRQDFFEFTPASAADRRQPQTRPPGRRRGNPAAAAPDPLHGHDPRSPTRSPAF